MPHAHIKHKMPGRVRLHIPTKKHDPGYFARVGQKLTELEGIKTVRADSRTGTLLITHEGDLDAIGDFAERHGLFSLVTTAAAAVMLANKLADRVGNLDQGLVQFTRGQMDLRSAMVAALATAAAFQVLRKQVLPPAFTLAWAALALVWPKKSSN
jgi:hypothetical protein